MQTTLRRVARFVRSDAPVVLFGETGTGKEVVARLIHGNSARASGPFVPVNVAALPADLLESELFGHAAGAFPGAPAPRTGRLEEAARGTLYLRQIGALSPALQARLAKGPARSATGQDMSVYTTFSTGPRRAGDTTAVYADTTKSREVLGWKPTLTLSDALRDAALVTVLRFFSRQGTPVW